MKILLISFFMLGGLFFFIVGTIGILRLPDVFTRAHSAAKCDTLGAVMSMIALIIYSGINFVSLKIVIILAFIWITNPTATHLIVKAEYIMSSRKEKDEVSDIEDI